MVDSAALQIDSVERAIVAAAAGRGKNILVYCVNQTVVQLAMAGKNPAITQLCHTLFSGCKNISLTYLPGMSISITCGCLTEAEANQQSSRGHHQSHGSMVQ